MHFSVSCPSCQTEFPVDSEKVPSDGVHAICSTCERVFLVERPAEAAPAEDAEQWSDATTATPDVAPVVEGEGWAGEEDEWEEEEEAADQLEETEDFRQFFEPAAAEPEEAVAEVEAVEEVEAAAEPEVETEDSEEEDEDEAPAVETPRFGQQDPHEKAARLARVLVQDMIAYNKQLHEQALSQGTLKDDFEEEVRKSWEEYVDRIGREMATSTSYFKDALNDILAQGDQIFDGPP